MAESRNVFRLAGMIGLAGLVFVAAHAAFAQDFEDNNDALRAHIQRLERDVHDLQQEMYRNGGGAGAPRSLAPAPLNDGPPSLTAPLTQRVSDLEAILQRLTGQIEQLQHDNDVLSQKVQRLQNEVNLQQNNGPAAASPDDAGVTYAEPPPRGAAATSTAPRNLAPGPSDLGAIPQNTPMPLPKPGAATSTATAPVTGGRVASIAPSGAGAQADYDQAMALLRKAQYEAAQQAFRNFADLHPTDPHAPEALFWTGDIAYSARHDYGSAARAFAELLKKYGKAGRAPEGMLKLGLSLLGLGQKQEGCATLAALPVKYANAAPALITRAAAERKRAACS